MVVPYNAANGILTPEELSELQSVFDVICLTNAIALRSEGAEALAFALMVWYQHGCDSSELRARFMK